MSSDVPEHPVGEKTGPNPLCIRPLDKRSKFKPLQRRRDVPVTESQRLGCYTDATCFKCVLLVRDLYEKMDFQIAQI